LELTLIDFKKLNSFWFYIASLEGNLDLLERLIDYAQKNHIKVALNPGQDEIEQKEELLKLAKKVDVFNVNQEEAARLTDLSLENKKVFSKLCSLLPKTMVVVTKGVEGLVVKIPQKGVLTMDGFKVKMVDQTGAGDGFGSGFIGGLAKGLEIEKALKLGVANGASVVMKIGAKDGLIKEQEIDYWLEKPLKFTWQKVR
jgi:sugar/nucleoside kinase (ribokinase family)